jgi:thiol-disulfide isomerase/thioredoxin
VSRSRQILLIVAVALIAAAMGFGAHLLKLSSGSAGADVIMRLRLPDLAGHEQELAQWRGRVLVVNFWATWCAPCREEIPAFVSLQAKYGPSGAQFVGIAIDRREKVAEFAREFRINYPILLAGIEMVDVTRQAGNRVGALPYTLVFDRHGRIVASELGRAREAELERKLRSLL